MERIIKKYGVVDSLEAMARFCQKQATRFGEGGKKSRSPEFKNQGFDSATNWRRRYRGIQKLVGELRHDEPDTEPVGRRKQI